MIASVPGVTAIDPAQALNNLLIALAQFVLQIRGVWVIVMWAIWLAVLILVQFPRVRAYNPKVFFWMIHVSWAAPLAVLLVAGLPIWIGVLHPAQHPLVWPKGDGGVG